MQLNFGRYRASFIKGKLKFTTISPQQQGIDQYCVIKSGLNWSEVLEFGKIGTITIAFTETTPHKDENRSSTF